MKGFLLLKRAKMLKNAFMTSEIESWLNFGLKSYIFEYFGHFYLPKKVSLKI